MVNKYASEQSNDKALCIDWCTLLCNNIHTKIHYFRVLLLRRREKRKSWYFIVRKAIERHYEWKTEGEEYSFFPLLKIRVRGVLAGFCNW